MKTAEPATPGEEAASEDVHGQGKQAAPTVPVADFKSRLNYNKEAKKANKQKYDTHARRWSNQPVKKPLSLSATNWPSRWASDTRSLCLALPVGFARTVASFLRFAVSFHMAEFTAVEACPLLPLRWRLRDVRGLGRVGSSRRSVGTDAVGVTGSAVARRRRCLLACLQSPVRAPGNGPD